MTDRSRPIPHQDVVSRYRPILGVAALAVAVAGAWWQSTQGMNSRGPADRGLASYPANAVWMHTSDIRDSTMREWPTEQVVEALAADNPRTRRDAVLTLLHAGEVARPHLGALRSRLWDTDPTVRSPAATALGQLDRGSLRTVVELVALLHDADIQVRNAASNALLEQGSVAVPLVLPVLADRDENARLHAAQILQRQRRNSEEVLTALRRAAADPSPAVREVAVVSLLLEQQFELPEVIRLIHDRNANISEVAVANLPWFGPAAAAALPDLIDRLRAPLPRQLSWLLFALRSLHHDAAPAVPALIRLLDSPVAYDVSEILETLVEVGADTRLLSKRLVRCLDDESARTAWQAGRLLARIDPSTARQQASRLVEMLDNRNEEAVIVVLSALRGLGPAAADIVPRLTRFLGECDPDAQEPVARVLAQIGPEAAPATPVIAALIDETPYYSRSRLALIEACGAIGERAAAAIPSLMKLIRISDDEIRQMRTFPSIDRCRCAALVSSAKIGARDPEFLALARMALTSDSMSLRIAALQALSIAGEPAVDRLPSILPALEHVDAAVRLIAAQTIVSESDGNPQVVAALVQMLGDSDLEVRAAAALSLGRLGPAAADAIPALRATRGSRDNYFPLRALPARGRSAPIFVLSSPLLCFSVAEAVDMALRQIAPTQTATTAP